MSRELDNARLREQWYAGDGYALQQLFFAFARSSQSVPAPWFETVPHWQDLILFLELIFRNSVWKQWGIDSLSIVKLEKNLKPQLPLRVREFYALVGRQYRFADLSFSSLTALTRGGSIHEFVRPEGRYWSGKLDQLAEPEPEVVFTQYRGQAPKRTLRFSDCAKALFIRGVVCSDYRTFRLRGLLNPKGRRRIQKIKRQELEALIREWSVIFRCELPTRLEYSSSLCETVILTKSLAACYKPKSRELFVVEFGSDDK